LLNIRSHTCPAVSRCSGLCFHRASMRLHIKSSNTWWTSS
jgi:hypothetical protein